MKSSGSNSSLNKSSTLTPRVYGTKIPGPFANDPNEPLPKAFLDERRRARCWRDDCVPKVRKPWKPVPYAPQKNAWLRASPEVVRPRHLLAPKEPKAPKVKPITAEQRRRQEKERIQKLVVERLLKKPAPVNSYVHLMAEWVLLGLAPLDKSNEPVMKLLMNNLVKFQGPHLPCGRCKCQLCLAPRLMPKCPGPLVAAGDTNACIPLGFFDERRKTLSWENYVAERYVAPKYVPQRNAWLWASRPFVRPRHMRAPKEKKIKEKPITVIYQAPPHITLPIGPLHPKNTQKKRRNSTQGVKVPEYTNHVVITPTPRTFTFSRHGELAARALRDMVRAEKRRRSSSRSFNSSPNRAMIRNRAILQPSRGV